MPYIIAIAPKRVGFGSPSIPRRAVATVRDARQEVFGIAEDALGIGDLAAVDACRAVQEDGRTQIELPNGVGIEVERVVPNELVNALGTREAHYMTAGELIEAFNA